MLVCSSLLTVSSPSSTVKRSTRAGCRCSPTTRAPTSAVSSAVPRLAGLSQGRSRIVARSPVTGFSQTSLTSIILRSGGPCCSGCLMRPSFAQQMCGRQLLLNPVTSCLPVIRQVYFCLMQPHQESIGAWRDSAPFWEKHREIIRQMFAPVTQALVEDGLIGRGQAVLDIATGPKKPALTIAALVGPEGKVFGIDPVVEMIEAARRAADHLGFSNAQFDVASVSSLPFPADTFDAVTNRFGVMFFPSPVNAVREMLRVLKPGQKLVFAVWHFAERNPFHCSLSRVVDG